MKISFTSKYFPAGASCRWNPSSAYIRAYTEKNSSSSGHNPPGRIHSGTLHNASRSDSYRSWRTCTGHTCRRCSGNRTSSPYLSSIPPSNWTPAKTPESSGGRKISSYCPDRRPYSKHWLFRRSCIPAPRSSPPASYTPALHMCCSRNTSVPSCTANPTYNIRLF